FTDPAGIRLRRNNIAEVLETVEDIHSTVFDAILIASYETSANFSVKGILTLLIKDPTACIKTFDQLFGLRAVIAKPNWSCYNEDIRFHYLLEECRPFICVPSMLTHIRPDASGNVMINGADELGPHAMLFHNSF